MGEGGALVHSVSLARDFGTSLKAMEHALTLRGDYEIELDFSQDYGHRSLNVTLSVRRGLEKHDPVYI